MYWLCSCSLISMWCCNDGFVHKPQDSFILGHKQRIRLLLGDVDGRHAGNNPEPVISTPRFNWEVYTPFLISRTAGHCSSKYILFINMPLKRLTSNSWMPVPVKWEFLHGFLSDPLLLKLGKLWNSLLPYLVLRILQCSAHTPPHYLKQAEKQTQPIHCYSDNFLRTMPW